MKRIKRSGAPYVLRGYTEAQRQQLLLLISEGITRTVACETLGIPVHVVAQWVRDDEQFAEQWKRARLEQTHALADEILDIADAPAMTMAEVQHARLRIDARQWLMSKWAPRQYGEKTQTDHTHTVGVVLLPALDTAQKALKDVMTRLPGSDAK